MKTFKVSSKLSIAVVFVMVVILTAMPTLAQVATTSETTPKSFTEIYQTVSPSVVAISVRANNDANAPQPVNPNPSNPNRPDVPQRSGSGFVIDTEGHIVTNYHVVREASAIEVSFYDGTLARAMVIGVDPDSDLAVIQVSDLPAEVLVPVAFADSDALQVGETVLAIGSPFGERWTLTSGIISALERTIQGMDDFSIGGVIQTDAAINPGNSGGPLLNMDGAVIGVNSQILSASGSNSGIGFAIPSNLVQRVAEHLINDGYVQYSYLGIAGGNITLDLIEGLNLEANTRGVVVSRVLEGSPASRAGLLAAGNTITADNGVSYPEQVDIITAINGTPLTSIADLISYLAQNTQPGDAVTLSVLRNGTEELELVANLTPRP